MCKFCESNRLKSISNYDNIDSMNISYGQRQGVSIFADLSMMGNLMVLDGDGSYRSQSDCYYEDWGLEIDNKDAKKTTETKWLLE